MLEQTGPSHAPLFKVSVVVDGQQYVGTGKSKKLAKCNAAEAALRSFIQFPDNCKVISSNPSNNPKIDFTSDTFESGNKDAEIVEANNIKKNIVPKGPVMLLNELYPSSTYTCIENDGDIFARFKITVAIDGESFVGTGIVSVPV